MHHHFDSTEALAAEGRRRLADRGIVAFREAARDLVEEGAGDRALARWSEAGAHAQLSPAFAVA